MSRALRLLWQWRPPLPAIILIGLAGWAILSQGVWMDLNPAYREHNLLRLTPDEVVARLGEPYVDPLHPRHGAPVWSGRPEDGQLCIEYAQGWNRCDILFENGRVSKVIRHYK